MGFIIGVVEIHWSVLGKTSMLYYLHFSSIAVATVCGITELQSGSEQVEQVRSGLSCSVAVGKMDQMR